MREAPAWFNEELARVGGTNRYGDPIFKLVWSEEPRMVAGGRFADGFVGYRWVRAVPGDPCWALLIWEGPETYGDHVFWDIQYRDPETGLLEIGEFPREGRYRLLKRLEHRELVQSSVSEAVMTPSGPGMKELKRRKCTVHLIEPSGFILDLMIPMLLAWRKLTTAQKLEAVMERQRLEEKNVLRMTRDALHDSKVRRSSQLVQKRAELIEKGMEEAMRIASRYAPGMRQAG